MNSTGKQTIRVFLVDDHAVMRAGLRLLIGSRDGFEVAGEAATLEEAMQGIPRTRPDVILLDLDLGGISSIDSIPGLMAAGGTDCRIIILTGVRDESAHQQAVEMGAMGVVRKERAPEMLIKAIEKVHAGEMWVDRQLMTNLLAKKKEAQKEDPEARKISQLTAREREVIAVVAEGLRNREIGKRLFISEITVRHHLSSIFGKLDVKDRFELLIYAYRHGLVSQPKDNSNR